MKIDNALARLPAPLAPLLHTHWLNYTERLAAEGLALPALSEPVLHALLQTWAGSDFVAQQCMRRPQMFAALLASGELERPYVAGEMRAHVLAALAAATDDDTLMAALRGIRQREMLRIIWRDLAAGGSLQETVVDLSDL